ncbi:thiamine-phosphate kinase [Marinilabiliaceae bacterium ANBcel2]|nr:thiamine-phosphate kinase [Marinilabiliaceae bacterium ANBcel2]
MQLEEIGEFGFIKSFAKKFDKLIPPGGHGIGDDCAIIPISENRDMVISSDMLVEDVHFIKEKSSPEDLGYKSLAVNLSDIAAMGAKPTSSFLSFAIPRTFTTEYLDKFIEGYYNLSEKFNIPLMGGDTTSSPDKFVINITVTGVIDKGKAKLRSMAQEGDIIAVTDFLGDSAAGLHAILHSNDKNSKHLINRHNRPEPYLMQSQWLCEQPGVNAMMDISDGIGSDINHILNSSNKGAVIKTEQIPISSHLKEYCKQYKTDPLEFAISGGEDYSLLLTANENSFKQIAKEYNRNFKTTLFPIGKITSKNEPVWTLNNKAIKKESGGFNHFFDSKICR